MGNGREADDRSELSSIVRSLRGLVGRRAVERAAERSRDRGGSRSPGGTGASGAAAGTREAAGARSPAGALTKGANAGGTIEALGREVAGCRRCPLYKTRTNVVFGSGSGATKILFVGEAPGREEDLQGLPFVGRAGLLLTKIIEAIEFKRDDVYIANVLKCRPPQNRNPLPEEVARCRPFLLRQIELLEPKVVCTLGVFATQVLLDTKSPLNVLRGRVHRVNGLSVIPTYHPAACLRYPRLKAAVWEDVQLLREEYLS